MVPFFTKLARLPVDFGNWLDNVLQRKGWTDQQRSLVFHYWRSLLEQVFAVVPITLLLVLCLAIFFKTGTADAGSQAYGLVAAMFGEREVYYAMNNNATYGSSKRIYRAPLPCSLRTRQCCWSVMHKSTLLFVACSQTRMASIHKRWFLVPCAASTSSSTIGPLQV